MGRLCSRLWLSAVLALGATGSAALAGACVTTDNQTQLTMALTSEASIPDEVNLLDVTVSSGGSTSFVESYPLYRDSNGYFPQTLAIVPRDEASLNNPVTVTVTAYAPSSEPVVVRSVTASYVEGSTLLLPVALRMACFASTCDQVGYSCVGGQCVPDSVKNLQPYEARYVFEDPATCFDMQTCVQDSTPTVIGTEALDATGNVSDCTFPLPPGTSAPATGDAGAGRPKVNAAIEWAVAPGRIIVLEGGDAMEGWTVSATDPTKGVLSQGVCNAVKASPSSPGYAALKSTAATPGVLYLSTACEAKSPLSPSCDPSLGIGVACPNGTCAH